ncbi:hypothetical protein AAIE21_21045 [Paenibacillus sp. 102]|uniref:hypothetical protein n=1 Tax=Paenibacillus sp. 102 TaxID=3120823 RepID=UPI0031BB216B
MDGLSGRKRGFRLKNLSWIHFYFLILIVFSFLIRIYLASNLPGFLGDQDFFVNWMETVRKYGLADVYAHGYGVNYPPFFLAILGIYGKILAAFNLQAVAGDVLVRLPPILFDIVAIIILAIASKKIANPFIRAILVTFLALNPAVLLDGPIWGQIDMLHAILMVCSILLLVSNPLLSGVIFAIALLAKFQSIVIAPVFAIYFLKVMWEKREFKQLFKYILGFCIPLLIFGVYFAVHGTFYAMLQQGYLSAVGTFPTVTLNAMNIWYYIIGTTPDVSDSIIILPHFSLKRVGLLILAVAVFLAWLYVFFNRKSSTVVLLKASTFICFAFYMLPTQMHERYSFPTLIFVIFVLLYDIKWTGITLGLTFAISLNLIFVLYSRENNMAMFIATLNCFVFYYMGKALLKDYSDDIKSLVIKYNKG